MEGKRAARPEFRAPAAPTYVLRNSVVVRGDGLGFEEPFAFEFVEWRTSKRFANPLRLATFLFEYAKGYDGPIPPKDATTVVLFCHDSGIDCGSCLCQCHVLSQTLRVDVVCFDSPGFGLSGGHVSEATATESVVGVFQRLQLRFPGRKVIVYGQGMGSVPAIFLATKARVDGLVLDGAMTSAKDVVRGVPLYTTRQPLPATPPNPHQPQQQQQPPQPPQQPPPQQPQQQKPRRHRRHRRSSYPSSPSLLRRSARTQPGSPAPTTRHTSRRDSLRNIDRVAHTLTPAVLVVHGARDEVVGLAHAEALAHVWRSTQRAMVDVVVLRESGHCEGADRDQYEFFGRVAAFVRGVERGKWAHRVPANVDDEAKGGSFRVSLRALLGISHSPAPPIAPSTSPPPPPAPSSSPRSLHSPPPSPRPPSTPPSRECGKVQAAEHCKGSARSKPSRHLSIGSAGSKPSRHLSIGSAGSDGNASRVSPHHSSSSFRSTDAHDNRDKEAPNSHEGTIPSPDAAFLRQLVVAPTPQGNGNDDGEGGDGEAADVCVALESELLQLERLVAPLALGPGVSVESFMSVSHS